MKKINWVLVVFLFLVLFKSVIWTATVPIWQAPDEQAHFAQLQWYAEKKNTQIAAVNLSAEVALSEDLLGTRRDNFGNNGYTYHPEYNVEYTSTSFGKYESLINNQPMGSRTTMVATEAAMYPPLYYQIAVPFYDTVYSQGLIDRVFTVRILSVLLNLLLVICAYSIGTIVWGKGILPLVLAGLVAFQPMVSFVAAGIHPDNLLNFLYSAAILVCLLILKKGIKIKYLAALATLIYLGFETKQLMLLFIPVGLATVIYSWFKGPRGMLLSLLVLAAPLLVFFLPVTVPYIPHPTSSSPLASMNFISYLHFRLGKTFFEIWPWYWGVFKWLGLTLPSPVLKVITRIALLSGLGLIIYGLRMVKNWRYNFEVKAMILFLTSSLSYFIYLVIWDWRLMQANGFSQGLQGRYFFPNIVAELAVLLIGLLALLPTKLTRYKNALAVTVLSGMIFLNVIALHTVAKSYYDLSSPRTFLIQVSQYKPAVIKWATSLFP